MQISNYKHNGFKVTRILLLALLFIGIGSALELYLLDHYEDVQQLIPLLAIGVSLIAMAVLIARRTRFTEGLFRSIMVLTALSGAYGVFLHLQANFEFEQEMKPGAEPWDLFVESLSGALPALAPASLIAFALIGYAYYLLLIHQQ
ncbi:hypothetical protein [Aureitalea marina]|uniref:Uncharacterized protein n=1 Tax=Aureitalea marina TaxID=930804 RepID=A0A2S7KSV1_9FLAO|nr:hypothetical protein [Aureitalea marina]PQB05709.1 hypothetical protein BST85_12970 [Aureitalea marina]